ncbi:MAG: HAD hydrolase-like protein [Aestuariivirga sp.]
MPRFENLCLVFDLDDTIYNEIDFVRSGIDAVRGALTQAGFGTTTALTDEELRGGRAIDILVSKANAPLAMRESLLWQYRLHQPKIALSGTAKSMLDWAKTSCGAVAILSDGRAITQRNKLAALGLEDWPAFISGETGVEKSDEVAFLNIEKRWPNLHFAYVADNPRKDFLMPNRRGWITIGLRDAGVNIHGQDSPAIGQGPQNWISSLKELGSLLEARLSS